MSKILTNNEIIAIEKQLKSKDELKDFHLNEPPFEVGNYVIFVFSNGEIKLPIIIDAEQVIKQIAQKYSTANEVFIGIPNYENGTIIDTDLIHIPFKFPK